MNKIINAAAIVFCMLTGMIGLIADKSIEGVLWFILGGVLLIIRELEEIKNTNGE